MIWLVVALGIITSYTDIRDGKVRNLHLALFAVAGIALLIYSGAGIALASVNFLFALSFGYFLWHIGIWTSGDAKLFSVYALIVPLAVYQYGPVPYFPSATIMVNTFVPLFIFYFFKLVLNRRLEKLKTIKSSMSPSRIASSLVMIFAVSWPLDALNIPIFSNFFSKFLIIFIILGILESIKVDVMVSAIIISAMRLLLDSSVYSYHFLAGVILMAFIYLLTRLFLLELSFIAHSKEVDIHLLKPGMIPAEEVHLEGYAKSPAMHQSLLAISKATVFALRAEGLTEKDCQKLRRLKREGKLKFEHLRVYQTLPFAAFLFAGVLMTYLASGNLFIYLRSLF
jgi:hypothetical protein